MSSFVEIMSRVPPPFNMVVIIMLLICASSVISSIAKQIRKYASHRQELDFKREMLDRGMTVDEIAQVVRAHGKDSGGSNS